MIIEHKTFDLYGKKVFVKAVIKPPLTMPNPMLDEACFLYIRKGIGIAYSEADHITAYENEGILMKCGSYLNKMLTENEGDTYEAMAVHFYPEVLSKIYDCELPAFLKNKRGQLPQRPGTKIVLDDLFQKFFDSLLYYFSNPELVNEDLMSLKLKELLLLLDNTKESDKLHHILSSLFSPQAYSFKSIVESHLYDNLSIEDLAQIAGQSLSSFKRTFKEVFGSSPGKYIREQRLIRAADLLTTTRQSISEIAYTCAFNDLASFSNCFRRQFGCSPSDYRQASIIS